MPFSQELLDTIKNLRKKHSLKEVSLILDIPIYKLHEVFEPDENTIMRTVTKTGEVLTETLGERIERLKEKIKKKNMKIRRRTKYPARRV